MDFTDLNKTYSKDYYPLPSIDRSVDSISGYVVVLFLDIISGYHQILMDPKMLRRSPSSQMNGFFCYKVMPFGLKNAGVIYQGLMSDIFKDLVGTTVEVYVDDMVVKS